MKEDVLYMQIVVINIIHRICHDEEVNSHTLDSRKDVNKIRCKVCNTEQGVSNRCINVECNIEFGKYYCEVCRLWENREEIYKDIYHCEKCNICRKDQKKIITIVIIVMHALINRLKILINV